MAFPFSHECKGRKNQLKLYMLNSINISNLLIPEHFNHYENRKNVIIIIIWEQRNQIGIWTEETPQPMRKSF